MSSIIKSMNLFPEARFWRMDKKSQINHLFGGISSILIIAIIGAVFIYKLVEVFSKNIMTVTSLNVYQNDLTTIFTTQMHNLTHKPNMILFHNTTGNIDIRVYTSPSKWIFEGEELTPIPLELCTEQHFSAFSKQLNYEDLTKYYYDPLCLPLNQTFALDSQNLLIMDALCKAGVVCSHMDVLTIKIIYPTANPYQKQSEPWIYDYQDIDFTFQQQSMRTINILMGQERIMTDYALFPFQKEIKNISGLQATIPSRDELMISYESFRRIILNGKNVYNLHNRTFLKVLDALSYIGGIFNSLLAGFFIIKLYGQSFFEIHFAFKYFRKKEANHFGFFSFLKQSAWGVFSKAGCQLNWEKGQKREQLSQTIQDMMNVVYLQRRLEYLERAITILLEPHQRKGLQLVKSKQQTIRKQCKKHRYRDKLISFFKTKERRASLKDIQMNGSEKNKIKESMLELHSRKKKNLSQNKDPYGDGRESQTNINHEAWLQRIFQYTLQDLPKEVPPKEPDPLQQETEEEAFQSLSDQSEGVGPQQIQTEISNDLKRLMTEAETNEDPKSKMIVDLFEDRIREWLGGAIRDEKRQNNIIADELQKGS